MEQEKYTVNKDRLKNILGYIESDDIVIPELQRPFVWDANQVTKLIESLYKGLPTGFITIWLNDTVRLRNNKRALGKKIIIDGQQRITAIRSALLGEKVVTKEFVERNFYVAYNPEIEEFETQKPIHINSPRWVEDISVFFKGTREAIEYEEKYCELNPDMDKTEIRNKFTKLSNIVQREIGKIELDKSLTLQEATEIFDLMNSRGTKLGQEDFIMAKLSSDDENEGHYIWKTIDYFCKGIRNPKSIEEIPREDNDFAQTEYYEAIKWLANSKDKFIYVPTYNDILRTSYSHIFKDGLLKRLSNQLSGRNFKTKTNDDEVKKETFQKFKEGLFNYVNQNNFKQFNLTISSTGVKYSRLINSQSSLNNAYTIYLLLKENKEVKSVEIKSYVRRWYIMSVLSGRYSASSETTLDQDIKHISEKGFKTYFNELEQLVLNNDYWNTILVQDLESSSSSTGAYLIYQSAQIFNKANSLFSPSILVEDLIKIIGDVHHLFPKGYLEENNITTTKKKNQIANYVWLDKNINIDISDKAPSQYFNEVLKNCTTRNTLGLVKSEKAFYENLKQNCIPIEVLKYNYRNYETFLKKRRKLIAEYIKDYYYSL